MCYKWEPELACAMEKMDELGKGMKCMTSELQIAQKNILQQKEVIDTQTKRIADLEKLLLELRAKRPEEDQTIPVLTGLQEHIKRIKDDYARRKRRHGRATEDEENASPK